jgi:hypothetical protein
MTFGRMLAGLMRVVVLDVVAFLLPPILVPASATAPRPVRAR